MSDWQWRYGVAVDVVDAARFFAAEHEITEVYRAAFSWKSRDSVSRFRFTQLPRHVERADFVGVIARRNDAIVGFAYGFTGEFGQWWTDWVVSRVDTGIVDAWMPGHWEVTELAVLPAAQRCGMGAMLHDTLLLGLPHQAALLTTYRGDHPAPRLYRRKGWRLLWAALSADVDLYGLDLTATPLLLDALGGREMR